MKLKAVFLDKDGTIIPDVPYNIDTDKVTLSDGVIEGLQLLQSYGYLLVIVSNQSGIAHGYFTEEQLNKVREKINSMCSKMGIYLDGFYYCPHHPEGTVQGYTTHCECRKPHPGLLLKAAGDMDIDLSSSWMIGDILNDVEAGNRAGCKTILINNGNETEWQPGDTRIPEFFANDLSEAAKYILAANKVTSDEKKLERYTKYTMHKAG
ncbi:MAG TPA: HAD family hydrolase [Flavitalea sp.]|nr:HAD family hydrolase [Flavitalea sp.]